MGFSDFLPKPRTQAPRVEPRPPPSVVPQGVPESALVFWSAVDYAGEYQALMEAGVPVGIAVKRMSERVFDQFVRLVRATNQTHPTPIFVDSGAYSEDTGRFSDADWDRVLDRYEALAKAGGDRIFLVAPDEIGSFDGTEARLRKAAPRLRRLLDLGAHLLLPIQYRKGGYDFATNASDLERAAGVGRDDFAQVHPAIPWTSKVPVKPSMDDLATYLRGRRPARIHFLGVGKENADWDRLSRAVRSASPGTILQGDSNRFGAMRAEGRPLTRAGRLVDAGALELDPWSGMDADITDEEGDVLGDETENLLDLFAWTTPAERRRIANDAMLEEDLLDLFVSGPIEDFLDARAARQEETGAGDDLHEAIDAAWARRAERFAPDRRRHLATRRVLAPPPSEQSLLRAVERQAGLPVTDARVVAWMNEAGVGLRHGKIDYPAGRSNPEGARRRLADALDADAIHGVLFRMNPANAARVAFLQSRKQRKDTPKAASGFSAFLRRS